LALRLQRGQAGIDELVFEATSQRVEDVQGGVHDLGANAVALDDGNLVGHAVLQNGRAGSSAGPFGRGLSAITPASCSGAWSKTRGGRPLCGRPCPIPAVS